MSYTIHLRINQTSADWFGIVEKTVWHYANGGVWTEVNGENILTMNGSGTSGGLRLKNAAGDYAFVALGIHNYGPWVDVAVDLAPGNTGVEVHPTYYSPGSRSGIAIVPSVQKTDARGRNFSVAMKQLEDSVYSATITIS